MPAASIKKGLVILGALLLLLGAYLYEPYPRAKEMGSPSFIKILGMTTNASGRCCAISITNTTGGEMVFVPMATIVETAAGMKTNPVEGATLVDRTGFDCLFNKGQVRTLNFPVPEGAGRWKLCFIMSAQTTASRAGDTIHNLRVKVGLGPAGQWTSFGRHEIFTTDELPP